MKFLSRKSSIFFFLLLGIILSSYLTNPFSIKWKKDLPIIETPRLILRPIEKQDYVFYQKLFSNPIIMKHYLHGTWSKERLENRFNNWCHRWEENLFSAFVIIDKNSKEKIGHAILGHGSFQKKLYGGYPQLAYIIAPPYWNAKYQDKEKNIGTKNMNGIGSEVATALVEYSRDLKSKELSAPMNVDLSLEKQKEIESLIRKNKIKHLRNEEGKVTSIYLPLKGVVASCNSENTGSYRILEKIFIEQYDGQIQQDSRKEDRNYFIIFF